jgi:hypothetical protein
MTGADIARRRLWSLRLAGAPFAQPEDVAHWMGAVQAQDYPAAQWALGLRLREAHAAEVDQAFAEGRILRTHVMRPTWHFVTPADIRWLLALTGPRVQARNAPMYRRVELDEATLARGDALLAGALEGDKQLTRAELGAALRRAGMDPQDNFRLGCLLMHAELSGVVCSGAKRGKQFTYALLAERAPGARTLGRDESLAELAGRYFTSHGPATLQDFVWWSGLTTTDARAGIALAGPRLVREVVAGQTYWLGEAAAPAPAGGPVATLAPNYDEYAVGYADRSAMLDAARTPDLDPRQAVFLGHTILIDGQVVGVWKRTLGGSAVTVSVHLFTPLSAAETAALEAAVGRYGAFVGLHVVRAPGGAALAGGSRAPV